MEKLADNYVLYHCHSDDSLLDSCTNFKAYVDRAVDYGMKAIAFTEHGRPRGWVHKKLYCEEKGIRYIHGVECYLTRSLSEKVRDNYHTILLAKNERGVRELNAAVSRSCDEAHTYYVNRLSFDEFLSLSDDVIKISACLASPLNRLDVHDEFYERLARHYDYLEIQPHRHPEQAAFNRHLAALAGRLHKPLIAGTDTHSLDAYKADCRRILLKAKGQSYGDEDAFDLTMKSYDELLRAFQEQDALPEALYREAIENTCVMADAVEDFTLDLSFKYPKLYGDSKTDYQKFIETIDRKFREKLASGVIPPEQEEAFRKAIAEEVGVFRKIDMCGFMLSMSEIVSWCKENGIPVGPARGSVGGSRVAYVTDITDLNPETWHTVFSRFCNEDRREIGDIDIDLIESDRPKVFDYIIGRFGREYTARVPALTTIAEKGTIDEICRALSRYWEEEHPGKKNPYSLKAADRIKETFVSSPERAREQYPEVFRYFDGLLGTKVAQSVHPAGIVISPVTLADHYGIFYREGQECLMIDMEEIHEVSLVKYDLLLLSNLKIIRDACRLAGIPYPKSHEMNWEDEAVWQDMLTSPVGIFQFEGDFAFSLLKEYRPRSIFDMSLVTAAIRPSGASYRRELIAHVPHRNPSPLIDDLLRENNGYLIYQEDTIKFLQQVCGLSGSEADNIRRAIGRKDRDRLEKALPQILEGYCRKSERPRAQAEQEAKAFLQIIEDSASYQFGYNHSIAYCLIGYLCAWLRKYYPYEFITAYLCSAQTAADIRDGTELAALYKIRIAPPRFGLSGAEYRFDREQKVIAKGIASVKFLNRTAAEELYRLSHEGEYTSFMDVLLALTHTSLNARQTEILIKIDYFAAFGNIPELSRMNSFFQLFRRTGKEELCGSISKEKAERYGLGGLMAQYASGKTKAGAEAKSWTVTDMPGLLRAYEEQVKAAGLPDLGYRDKIQNQQEYMGYIDLTTNREEDRKKLILTDVVPLRSKADGSVWGYALFTKSIGSGKTSRLTLRKRLYDSDPVQKLDIIYANSVARNPAGWWYLQDYEKIIG